MKKELRIKKKYLKYIFLGSLLSFLAVYNKTNFETSEGGGAPIVEGGTVHLNLKSIGNEIASSFSSDKAIEEEQSSGFTGDETSKESEETFAFGNGNSGFIESSNFSSGLSNSKPTESVAYHSQSSSVVEYNSTSYSSTSSSPIAFESSASPAASSSRQNSFHQAGSSSRIAKAGFKGGFSGFGNEAPMEVPPPPSEPVPLDKEAYILMIVGIAFGLFQLFKIEGLKNLLKVKGN